MEEIGYTGGTVTLAPGGTTVAGSSVLWGANLQPGDTFEAAGDRVTIASATNNELTLVRAWGGAGLTASAAYFIRYDSTRRDTVDLSLRVRQLIRIFEDTPNFLPLDNPPDDSIGADGQFGIVTETFEMFLKVSGSWVSQGQALGVAWTVGSTPPDDANGKNGDFYLLDNGVDERGVIYRKESGAWVVRAFIRGPQGIQGDQGPSGTIEVDPVVDVLAPDELGTVANTGTPEAATLKFALPQGIRGPRGEGIDIDAQVDTLGDRSAYDASPQGFRVLVSDDGNGRPVLYSKNSATSGDWSDPAALVLQQVTVADFADGQIQRSTDDDPNIDSDEELVTAARAAQIATDIGFTTGEAIAMSIVFGG